MSLEREAISVRTARLNNLMLGRKDIAETTNKHTADALGREGLLDTLILLYDECNKTTLTNRDRNIYDFVKNYRPIINETKNLRVNINDFEVKTMIGKGYFGNVNLVSEKTTRDVYALKKIRKSAITSSQVKEERDIMACKSSDWITPLQYAFQDLEYLYLVMEYLPGGDFLSLMIRNGAFDEDLAKFYLAELTLALNTLHSMGYVHRDIKPENILLDRCGHLKLADFGNAASLNKDGSVTSMSPVGTPDYIAPELLQTLSTTVRQPRAVHNVTCDFWSMGVIGYELITEVTPFHDPNVHETYSKILSHCDDVAEALVQQIEFPDNLDISNNFRDLIRRLVTKPSKRISYSRIVSHPFFDGINWPRLRHQMPPIIPNVSGDDDTSNFENIEKKSRQSTYGTGGAALLATKSKEFSGENLPFLGYSYVHEAVTSKDHTWTGDDERQQASKLSTKMKDLQVTVRDQVSEIKALQENLLSAERKTAQMESMDKILRENKSELNAMKEKLKEKAAALASTRTEVKTLKSSLKIEEEARLKNDASISELLSSTYHKWERAKDVSDQNYEKQISEKKTELSQLVERLDVREIELRARTEEIGNLKNSLEQYKDLLKTARDQQTVDKTEIERKQKHFAETYNEKFNEYKTKLKQEKEAKHRLQEEVRELRRKFDEHTYASNSAVEVRKSSEKNIEEMKSRVNREISDNKSLREAKATVERACEDWRKRYDELKRELAKTQSQLIVASVAESSAQTSMIMFDVGGSALSSPYRSANGSFQDVNVSVEDQLRNDLQMSKENETRLRKRAEGLEEVVSRLEEVIKRVDTQPQSAGQLLEKQNSKLEDQLIAAREQAIVERQAARTANLALWKLEKQMEEMNLDKKMTGRRIEQTEERTSKLREEKMDAETKLKHQREAISLKENEITILREEIADLKAEVKKEHGLWTDSENERSREKTEIIEQIARIQKLKDQIDESRRKMTALDSKNESLTSENRRLSKMIDELKDSKAKSNESCSDLQIRMREFQQNYESLKEACQVTEAQLTDLEIMLDTEMKRNKESAEKVDQLLTKLRAKDDEIAQLQQDKAKERSLKSSVEDKLGCVQNELEDVRNTLETIQRQFVDQQKQLITKTNTLYETQERVELLSSDASHMQRVHTSNDREMFILKEENSKILTELYLAKEEMTRVGHELKESHNLIGELRLQIDHLTGSLSEQKHFYVQRDVKAEATLAQHKKLIDYLQAKVEEHGQQRRKKTLADKLFGSHTGPKKENFPPNVPIDTTVTMRRLQEDLRRERTRTNQLKEQLLKAKTDLRSEKVPQKEEQKDEEVKECGEPAPVEATNTPVVQRCLSTSSRRRTSQTHRFEMTLEMSASSEPAPSCNVCGKMIVVGSPYWRCKECLAMVHRKCRSEVNSLCGTINIIQERPQPTAPSVSSESDQAELETIIALSRSYFGEALFQGRPPLIVNCAHAINENFFLLGCNSGLFSWNREQQTLVHIGGIKSVEYIAINPSVVSAILIGSEGEYLYQCDLRHLLNRAQSSECLRPKLETTVIDLPFSNRSSAERWYLARIHGDTDSIDSGVVIAATSSRIVILKYDAGLSRFKPVRALDTAIPVETILFTRHTAIVCADKFFEIDLNSFAAEEFQDMSDPSIQHTISCRPMAAFQVNDEELLLCFAEFGVFCDEYGCRSRPNDVMWKYPPTGFLFRSPLLFIAHANALQVMRINRSYTNELARSQCNTDPNADCLRAFIDIKAPKILGETGDMSVLIAVDSEVVIVDGLHALKKQGNRSLETISSSMTSIHLNAATSSDTLDFVSK